MLNLQTKLNFSNIKNMKGLINASILFVGVTGTLYFILNKIIKTLKLYSYDSEPIRFWFNKKVKLKKRYKTFKLRKRKYKNLVR
jgi:hypothetical protein